MGRILPCNCEQLLQDKYEPKDQYADKLVAVENVIIEADDKG